MTDIEQKALALVNEVRAELGKPFFGPELCGETFTALCRSIEQHEQFKREVSDAVDRSIDDCGHDGFRKVYIHSHLARFILPKPVDPLVEACTEAHGHGYHDTEAAFADQLRAALAKRGGKIVWENKP